MNVADFNASGKPGLANCESIQEIHEAIDSVAHEVEERGPPGRRGGRVVRLRGAKSSRRGL